MLIDKLNNLYLAYINNIIIFSQTLKDYQRYIFAILEKLRSASFQANLSKYKFYVTKIKFFGFIIGANKVETSLKKLEAVYIQHPLIIVKEV